jgi:hypothetical protein
VVQHQARKYGETKFGMFINGFLFNYHLVSFPIWKRPMHLFGAMGSLMFIIGFLLAGYIGVSKLYHMFMNMRYSLVTNNPWFLLP